MKLNLRGFLGNILGKLLLIGKRCSEDGCNRPARAFDQWRPLCMCGKHKTKYRCGYHHIANQETPSVP